MPRAIFSTFLHLSGRPRRFGLRRILALRQQRRGLGDLDAAALRDLGLSREAAEAEARRPLWDVPEDWRR